MPEDVEKLQRLVKDFEKSLSKNELKVIALLQSYGTVDGAFLKKNVFSNRKDRTEIAMNNLHKRGIVKLIGLTKWSLTNEFPLSSGRENG